MEKCGGACLSHAPWGLLLPAASWLIIDAHATLQEHSMLHLLQLSLLVISVVGDPLPAPPERPAVLAHYMPWYESQPVSGFWGWHWTMNHFTPPDQFATHDPPLAGLYDSGDPDLLEYHAALMVLSGVDGVIFDWYGVSAFRDYPSIHEHTQAMMEVLRRAGLQYAICYEDQSVGHRAAELGMTREQALQQGRQDLAWLAAEAFADPAYAKVDARPLLLVFGPQWFEAHEWAALLGELDPRPLIYGLPHLAESTGMDGAFGWPPVNGGIEITPEAWGSYLDRLYERTGPIISVVFPGFRDIYEEAGVHASYGFIDARGGATFAETWDRALQSGAPVLQIATWNDFGEGTVVEPTRDLEYTYLEMLQQQFRPGESPGHLRLPLRVYRLRKENSGDAVVQSKLQRASDALLADDPAGAAAILEQLSVEE